MVDKDVLVVTHPLAPASEVHVESLLDILSEITGVALVTMNLAATSTIRNEYEVIEISEMGVGESILVAMVRFFRNQLRMCRVVWSRDEEIVWFFGAVSYLVPILVARLRGKTVVLQPRGNVPLTLRLHWQQRVPNPLAKGLASIVVLLEHLGYSLAHAIVTYTSSMAIDLGLNRYEHKLHSRGARYLDINHFTPTIPFDQRDRVVGYLGRLDEEKNIRTLAEAIKKLPDGIIFRFIGDGDLRGWLEDRLTPEIDAGTVEIVGWVPHEEVPDQLNELRLLVLPSQPTEGLPTVLLESMACGTPTYAAPVSGVQDLIDEGETGFYLDNLDPESIAADIKRILSEENLAMVSDRARITITAKFNFDAAVERYAEILNRL